MTTNEESPKAKPDQLTLWLPAGLFVAGLATCTVSPICLLLFGGAAWAGIYRFKQFADYEYNLPDDNPGYPPPHKVSLKILCVPQNFEGQRSF